MTTCTDTMITEFKLYGGDHGTTWESFPAIWSFYDEEKLRWEPDRRLGITKPVLRWRGLSGPEQRPRAKSKRSLTWRAQHQVQRGPGHQRPRMDEIIE